MLLRSKMSLLMGLFLQFIAMYVTEAQTSSILQEPFFSLPYTEKVVDYDLYRGRLKKLKVYTIRFNLIDSYSQNFMIRTLWQKLRLQFSERYTQRLSAVIEYDVLLVKDNVEPKSYYLWRANSNQKTFYSDSEIGLQLTFENIRQFSLQANIFDLEALNIYFEDSNVKIDKILAIVCSFSSI